MDTCLAGLAARGLNPRCIFDVGAADDQWTRLARSFWPASSYVLFEPLTERAPELDHLKELHPNVTWHNCGLGSARSRLELSISADLFISSLAYGGNSSRAVAVESLDFLLAERKILQGDFFENRCPGF